MMRLIAPYRSAPEREALEGKLLSDWWFVAGYAIGGFIGSLLGTLWARALGWP